MDPDMYNLLLALCMELREIKEAIWQQTTETAESNRLKRLEIQVVSTSAYEFHHRVHKDVADIIPGAFGSTPTAPGAGGGRDASD